jgi:adenine phosphoribosyltransferase
VSSLHPVSGLVASRLRDVPDFPRAGVVFKDITPLLGDPGALAGAVSALAEPFAERGITKVVGIEARGFVVGAPVALHLGAGFVPVRKPGKLPGATESEEYELEYGTDRLEIHADAIEPREQVLIVDDVIATGGTAAAAVRLVERLGGTVVGLGFVIELAFLDGRAQLAGHQHVSLLTY